MALLEEKMTKKYKNNTAKRLAYNCIADIDYLG